VICPKCNFEQPDGMQECTRCGVVFAKLKEAPGRPPSAGKTSMTATGAATAGDRFLTTLRELFLAAEPDQPPLFIAGRAIVLALMFVWGLRFIAASISSGYAAETVLHLIHLPFHEAGHVIFGLSGIRFISVLGGTIGQLLIPLIIIIAFVMRRNPFGGAVGLWWLGQSLMDVAIYADDARSGQLPLLGGVTGSEVEDYHDWEFLLGRLGWLTYDHRIAGFIYACGSLVILLALVWGTVIVWRQLRLLSAATRS
jgi:hypothetical protein